MGGVRWGGVVGVVEDKAISAQPTELVDWAGLSFAKVTKGFLNERNLYSSEVEIKNQNNVKMIKQNEKYTNLKWLKN